MSRLEIIGVFLLCGLEAQLMPPEEASEPSAGYFMLSTDGLIYSPSRLFQVELIRLTFLFLKASSK